MTSTDIRIGWRTIRGLHWPVNAATNRHPIPPGCGAECHSALETAIIEILHKHGRLGIKNDLVPMLRERGITKGANERQVRETIAHLQTAHLIPVTTNNQGAAIATCRQELADQEKQLRQFAQELMDRADALSDIQAVACEHDQAPLIQRIETKAMSTTDAERKRKRERREDIISENAKRPQVITDALETTVSDQFAKQVAAQLTQPETDSAASARDRLTRERG